MKTIEFVNNELISDIRNFEYAFFSEDSQRLLNGDFEKIKEYSEELKNLISKVTNKEGYENKIPDLMNKIYNGIREFEIIPQYPDTACFWGKARKDVSITLFKFFGERLFKIIYKNYLEKD